jgi:NAD(P)-dependent dehydrogenase (short-subunit alcohol dehydrogenase family)
MPELDVLINNAGIQRRAPEVGFGPTAAAGFIERTAAERQMFDSMARFPMSLYRADGSAA